MSESINSIGRQTFEQNGWSKVANLKQSVQLIVDGEVVGTANYDLDYGILTNVQMVEEILFDPEAPSVEFRLRKVDE